MDQAHRYHRLVDQDLQQTQYLVQFFPHHNLNRVVMVDIRVMFRSKAKVSMGAKLGASTQALVELAVIKQLDKAIRVASMEDIKPSEAITIMAIASSAADGAATMDTNDHA